jgi:uncharacterized protein (DUF58 family)
VFNGRWLIVAIFLLMAALFLRQSPLLVVAVLFTLTSVVVRAWSRYCLQKVSYRRTLSSTRAFFGDTITLELSIANNKFLPLPRIHVAEEIPADLTFPKGELVPSYRINRKVLSNRFSLGWYRKLSRRYPVQCMKRGDFVFGPTEIESSDPFGFLPKELIIQSQEHLLVYPPIVPLEELGIPSRHPFGDLRNRRHLFEDPEQAMTTRDYVPGDPLKRVHWRATARAQRMQSRVYEKTTSVDLAVFLDVRTVSDLNYWAAVVPNLLESAIIVAASIAADTINKGNRVGFYANEYHRDSDRVMRFPPSRHPDRLKEILEALACIRGIANITANQHLAQEAKNLAWETTMVLVTAVLNDEIVTTLKHVSRAGRRVAVVVVGADSKIPQSAGLLVYQVSESIYTEQLNSFILKVVS